MNKKNMILIAAFGAATVAVYPLLIAVSVVINALMGDGELGLYLLPHSHMRLAKNVLIQGWFASMPLAALISASLLVVSYGAYKLTTPLIAVLVTVLFCILVSGSMGLYVSRGAVVGVVCFVGLVLLSVAIMMAVRYAVRGR